MENRIFSKAFFSTLFVVGLIWTRSSLGKIIGGNFPETLSQTLTKFAQGNPNTLYKSFLETMVIPNGTLFGYAVLLGELFSALALTIPVLYVVWKKSLSRSLQISIILGTAIGAFLNLSFWLAAGWMSPSTDSLNLLMLVVQVIALFTLSRLKTNSK